MNEVELVNCFNPEVENFCLENNVPFSILLVSSHASMRPAHLSDHHPTVKVEFIQPNRNVYN
jgi:hypothetical protein